MQDQINAIDSLAKSKRKSPVDMPMILGVILICVPSFPMYFLQNTWLVMFPIIIMCIGIGLVLYAIRMHYYFCKNAPEMLMPAETQVQTRILRMLLSDGDISQKNKVEIMKQMSGPPNNPSIGGTGN